MVSFIDGSPMTYYPQEVRLLERREGEGREGEGAACRDDRNRRVLTVVRGGTTVAADAEGLQFLKELNGGVTIFRIESSENTYVQQ